MEPIGPDQVAYLASNILASYRPTSTENRMILYYHPGGCSLPMLDAEARMLLDLMDKAVQEGRRPT
jgi:hypothetical protein